MMARGSDMVTSEDKLRQLERTILELGTEIFRIKSEMGSLRDFNDHFVEVMKGLKNILDEKGLITADDFENAVALGQALTGGTGNSFDSGFEEEIEKIKKTSH